MRRARPGFTLIELLVVVTIIGLLAAIGIPAFANSKNKANYTAVKSDLRNLATAEEAFYSDSGKYTANLARLNFKMSTNVGAPVITTGVGFWTATATHAMLPSTAQCGIGVNTTNPVMANAGEGVPACR